MGPFSSTQPHDPFETRALTFDHKTDPPSPLLGRAWARPANPRTGFGRPPLHGMTSPDIMFSAKSPRVRPEAPRQPVILGLPGHAGAKSS